MMFPSFRIHKAGADEETRDIESKVAAYQAETLEAGAHLADDCWNGYLYPLKVRSVTRLAPYDNSFVQNCQQHLPATT